MVPPYIHEPLFEPSALANLKFYRYSAVDKSPLTKYVLRHWWDLAASFFPVWMAPNVITLSGLGFILINILTLMVYLGDLVGPSPSWVYYSFALGLFLYQTFDNVDGRQARRTGSSSALGHIFDHTIDSLNTPLGGLLQVAALGLGHSRSGVFMVIIGLWPMWLSTWEEYYTGTLYLGYVNGPTEGILIACCVHLISGFFGTSVWTRSVEASLPFSSRGLMVLDLFKYFVIFAVFGIHAPACIFNVYKICRQNSFPFYKTLVQHIPFIVYNLLVISWILSPYSMLLVDTPQRNGSIFHPQRGGLIEFALLVTLTFGRLGPRIILARLTKSPFPGFNLSAFGPLIGGVAIINLPFLGIHLPDHLRLEFWYLRMVLAYAVSDFVFWFVTLCQKFMVTLNIGCLSITTQKKGI